MMLKDLHFGQHELNIFSVFLVLPLTGGDMDTWVMQLFVCGGFFSLQYFYGGGTIAPSFDSLSPV